MRSRDEVLTVESINDRIRELEAQQAASEPVAWAVMLPNGKPITFAASREGVSYWERTSDLAIVPLYAHPSAAAVNSHQSVPSDHPSAASEPVACERCVGLTNALGFFASVIKSGEGWSAECENIVRHAYAHPSAAARAGVSEQDKSVLEHLEWLCNHAYEHGCHELGYNPVEYVRNRLTASEGASA